MILLILGWTLALWLLGWLALPLSRRLFVALPDGGLAAGRFSFILVVALLAFWGAALHVLPLSIAPLLAFALAIAGVWGWTQREQRAWARENWRALAISDAIFLLAWAAFLWIRLRHPEAGDLEKPMDAALLGAAWKADWLPFQNPYFSGAAFTNYYYFGPLMGALMGRAGATPPHLAYNLVQPAFCAFFLSLAWSVGAALSRSNAWGVAVMILVGLGGSLEPLRQRAESGAWWPVDWWKTSRVIPDTINEYPAFTLTIGDAHAHFYALSLAMLWLALLWQLFAPRANRAAILGASGLVLGAWLLTNTWDAPVFSLLLIGAIVATRAASPHSRTAMEMGAPFGIALVTAAPYFWKFRSQVSGAVFDAWWPDAISLVLLWGGWGILLALAFLLPATNDAAARFRRLLIGAGAVALVAPFLFYIRGAFGDGPLRHQDTVFKFGLQAWLLLGVGISSELGARLLAAWRAPKRAAVWAPTLIFLGLCPILALAPAGVIWARAVQQNTGAPSLDAMRYLPAAERQAIEWLQRNGRAGEAVTEGVKIENGTVVGDYDPNLGRVAAFSGLSSTLGWPQHAYVWGADYGQVLARGAQIAALYAQPSPLETARGAATLGARYTFWGAREGVPETPSETELRDAGFSAHSFNGEDGSRALILERIGR